MSFSTSSSSGGGGVSEQNKSSIKKYKGIRRRKWGKWVSEIRVPGTSNRLWLGSYSTAEGAAAAHDVASFYLQSSSSMESVDRLFNFPEMVIKGRGEDAVGKLSPRSVQKAASDAGMAVDAAQRVFMGGSERGEKGEDGGNNARGLNNETMMMKTTETAAWSFGASSSSSSSCPRTKNSGGNSKAEDLNISVDDYL